MCIAKEIPHPTPSRVVTGSDIDLAHQWLPNGGHSLSYGKSGTGASKDRKVCTNLAEKMESLCLIATCITSRLGQCDGDIA